MPTMLFGGIGLFLLGTMSLVEGLKRAAGDALQRALRALHGGAGDRVSVRGRAALRELDALA